MTSHALSGLGGSRQMLLHMQHRVVGRCRGQYKKSNSVNRCTFTRRQSCQISSRSDRKRRSTLGFFWSAHHPNNKNHKMSTNIGFVPHPKINYSPSLPFLQTNCICSTAYDCVKLFKPKVTDHPSREMDQLHLLGTNEWGYKTHLVAEIPTRYCPRSSKIGTIITV